MRITWFMLHSGFLRFYRPVIEELTSRGHTVHLAFGKLEKDEGDARLSRDFAEANPSVTFEEAPLRPRSDGWRPIAGLTRSLIDLARYTHPRYADAPALRARMARKFGEHAATAKAIDPVSRAWTLRTIRYMETHTSEKLSRRMIAVLSRIEAAIPSPRNADDFLRREHPDAVLVTPIVEFASSQVDYVKSARKLGIPVGVAIASWDNLTGKGLIRVLPDRVFVWNGFQVTEAAEQHGMPRDIVVATGSPKFDEWFERTPSRTREELAATAGLDPARPFVLYACSSPFITPHEVPFVERWLGELRGDPRLADVGVMVRPHPQNARQWDGVDLSRFGNAAIWPPLGAQPDPGQARADFFDSLAHGAAVVGINTSALIEAAIVGRSVLAPLAPEFAGTQSGTLHFRYLLFDTGGFLHVGEEPQPHLDQLADVLAHGDDHAEQTRRFIQEFVRPHGLDRPAAPILADEIEALAALPHTPHRASAGAVALRTVLVPAALLAAGIAAVAPRLRRRA